MNAGQEMSHDKPSDEGEPMSDPEPVEDEGVLDAADTLEGDDVTADPLDPGVIPPDRWSAGMGFGSTEAEEREGESLDQLLSEEEPDVNPYPQDLSNDSDGFEDDEEQDPRSGRLVAEDEGAHSDEEPDLVATDVGIDAGAAGAEEAAVHVIGDAPDDE
jgi:Family of unknown function (DUF5709)